MSRQSWIPIGIVTTPAALPDGPPSRKGPLCSVLSPLPALYFYCKSPASPYAPEPIPKNSSALRPAQSIRSPHTMASHRLIMRCPGKSLPSELAEKLNSVTVVHFRCLLNFTFRTLCAKLNEKLFREDFLMFDPKRLLQYEFFPAELPPCFNSDDLAANAQHTIQTASKLNRDYSIPLTYSGYKSETARRKFAVPTPCHYCKAVDCIVQQEPVLKPIFEKDRGVNMFAASTYEEIERVERQVENMEIVVFLFARPKEENILKEFEYIHYNSENYCSIYAIGYTDDFTRAEDRTYRKVDAMMQQDWFFSMKAFTEFKEKLQDRIRWNYSGSAEILVLQNNPGQRNVLNFQNYVAIDVNKGIREGYIDSFESFMESLIRSSKRRVTAKEAISDIRNARISVKGILADTIDDCKKVPTPIKKIAKDRLFYRCANTIL